MAIDSIGKAPGLAPVVPRATQTQSAAQGFGDALGNLISSVDGSAADANAAVGRMLDGTGDVHEAVIALQKADTALQLTVQIRNKLMQAYQDVMRMSI